MLAIVSRSNSHSKRPTEKQKYNTKSTWKSHKPYSRFFPLDIRTKCVCVLWDPIQKGNPFRFL